MNISSILTSSLDRVKTAEEKTPLICLAVALLGQVYSVLFYLVFAIFGYVSFFVGLLNFFNVLSTIAYVVLGVYLVLLFVKEKQLIHLAGGIAVILMCFASGVLYSLLTAAAGVCIVWMSLKSEEEDTAMTAKLTICVIGVNFVLGLITMLVWRLPRFLAGLYYVIFSAVGAVMLFLLLVAVLHDSRKLGGVKSVVLELIAKIKKTGETPAPQPAPQPVEEPVAEEPVEEPVEVVAEQESVVAEQVMAEPVVPVAVPVAAVPGSGEYRYKTVAGPVGLTVSKDSSYAEGVTQYASIIQREAVDGWVFDSVYEIPVSKQAGCLATLMGQGTTTVRFNMLIFRKEV